MLCCVRQICACVPIYGLLAGMEMKRMGYERTEEMLTAYEGYLREEEHKQTTIEKYMRDIRFFTSWLGGRPVEKAVVLEWKEYLQTKGLAPATINAKLSALNGLFQFAGMKECSVKFLRIQRQMFREPSRELTQDEYKRLLGRARREGKERLALLIETICATGIRVSEVAYITVEAARKGRAEIDLKGKIRVILIPEKLCKKLIKYAEMERITCGEIFLTQNGKGLSRQQIWREMKELCKKTGVEPSKVFPHNLRHLFATLFYRVCKDIVQLADVLGHSSINTTRIYLMTTGTEHARHLEMLKLVM